MGFDGNRYGNRYWDDDYGYGDWDFFPGYRYHRHHHHHRRYWQPF